MPPISWTMLCALEADLTCVLQQDPLQIQTLSSKVPFPMFMPFSNVAYCSSSRKFNLAPSLLSIFQNQSWLATYLDFLDVALMHCVSFQMKPEKAMQYLYSLGSLNFLTGGLGELS